jgi:radical SAM superfamily enzyme
LILGFPWESLEEMLAMAEVVSTAGLDLLKIHHLHVVRDTALACEYQENPFHLLGYHEYLGLLVDFLERLNPDIKLERLFGHSPRRMLVGPIWDKNKAQIQRDIELLLESRQTWQGRLYPHPASEPSGT